jgi:hypothetical protein
MGSRRGGGIGQLWGLHVQGAPLLGSVVGVLSTHAGTWAGSTDVREDRIIPAPRNPEEPVPYEQTRTGMRAAERLAGLAPQKGGVWHPYRRLWVTTRKNLPDVDVGQAGGWSSLEALRSAYQQPDDSTMLQVVTHATELREIG